MKKALPIGVDNFKKIITENYYYVDKTMFIKELLDLKGEVKRAMRIIVSCSVISGLWMPVICIQMGWENIRSLI